MKIYDEVLSDEYAKGESDEFTYILTRTYRRTKVPFEIMVTAGNRGDENSVSIKVKSKFGTW